MTLRRSDERGAAAVEFAIILPLLVLLLMGIIDFSRAYSAQEALQYAVREGARELAIRNDPDEAVQVTRDRAIALDQALLSVPTPAACPSSPGPADAATVSATYTFAYNIPMWGSGTWSLDATGVMRCNG